MIKFENVKVIIPAHINVAELDLRRTVSRALLGAKSLRNKNKEVFLAPLDNISFEVKKGSRLGLLGLNGAGKTTLLKTISQIYPIASGRRIVEGRVRSFFNLGAGLDPLRSGKENIYLVGMYYTRHRSEIDKKRDDIIKFAELGEFISMPVSTYSSGMLARLLFSIATAFDADILLLDEWLGAGDATFIKKAQKRVMEMVNDASTMVLASHSFPLIQQMCDTCIWLERGKIRMYGPTDEVIGEYTNYLNNFYAEQDALVEGS